MAATATGLGIVIVGLVAAGAAALGWLPAAAGVLAAGGFVALFAPGLRPPRRHDLNRSMDAPAHPSWGR